MELFEPQASYLCLVQSYSTVWTANFHRPVRAAALCGTYTKPTLPAIESAQLVFFSRSEGSSSSCWSIQQDLFQAPCNQPHSPAPSCSIRQWAEQHSTQHLCEVMEPGEFHSFLPVPTQALRFLCTLSEKVLIHLFFHFQEAARLLHYSEELVKSQQS